MSLFQGLFFFVLGMGLLLIDYQSLGTRWLPCGSGPRGRLVFTRDEQPIGYWVMFAGYGLAGLWLLSFSLRLLAGQAEPLPLN